MARSKTRARTVAGSSVFFSMESIEKNATRAPMKRVIYAAPMLDVPTPMPLPANEPVHSYAPGSPERATLKEALGAMAKERPDVPHVVGGRELRDGAPFEVQAPHDHAHVL